LPKLGNFEPITAEALGTLHATEFCRDLGLQQIVLEGDALQRVDAIKSSGRCCSRYGHLVDETRDMLRMVPIWQIIHVKREGNSAAYGLAKVAIKHVIDQVWMEDFPSCISNIVLLEQIALFLTC
jgi:hypothetical protein